MADLVRRARTEQRCANPAWNGAYTVAEFAQLVTANATIATMRQTA